MSVAKPWIDGSPAPLMSQISGSVPGFWFSHAIGLIVAGLAFGAQNSFARAKELYAAAAYDDALEILETLHKTRLPASDARDVAVYRVFCLLALDRDQDAVKGIEAIVRADPLFRPTEAQASREVIERAYLGLPI